ncbi:carboxylating nicotinate-nucleotide diphosphorylase [Hydrogenophaga sp.]|uniref:carboxylating nicotinate-nucleotide diphosphorylase n=1 Tax=Hydrogenophaga sp. TaxID=1904254 RepID=UPI002727E178|nr:carboxylating nicotinate-nucleotide diphosphorylase [Hydrogenophaga sp.]MDO9434723.1 carboxylating nicotinate-nucleotide diphosphorylase [Hydrogenophaga sp.]
MKHLSEFTSADVQELARLDVERALSEDVGTGDLTAALVSPERRTRARILAREAAVICGAPWVEAAVKALDPEAVLTWHVAEGQRCAVDQVVLTIEGRAQPLLTAERTALNFLQLLSAVATRTATFVTAVAGTQARIVDTRKTLPGLRLAQKYAVKTGGGVNHRIGLYDAVLIKENHIAAAGGVAQVLQRVRDTAPNAQFVEIEVENLDELDEALACGATMILLDNMEVPELNVAVARSAGRALLEISGGVNMDTVRALAETGVDRISIGALTKDVKAVDFSMRFEAL